MPEWTVKFQYLYPFIILIINLIFNNISFIRLKSMIMLTIEVISLISICFYFKSVNMSAFWPFIPIVATIILAMGISSSISSSVISVADKARASVDANYSQTMDSNDSTHNKANALMFIALILIAAYLLACAVANFKVGKEFDKGILFITGLIVLPFIFKPILGYQKGD